MKQTLPVVSIIVPVYNAQNFLANCVGSVLSQSFLGWELILIDDGSTDESALICKNFAEQDSRICVIHQANSGPSAARNQGLERAKGKYIMFLDSDDEWVHVDLLKLLVEQAMNHGNDLILFNYCRILEDGTACKANLRFPEKAQNTNEQQLESLVQLNAYQSSAWTKLAHRSLVQKLRFEVGVRAEDIEWNAELLKTAQNIAYLDVVGYGYRVNKDSATQNISENFLADSTKIVERLIQNSKDCPAEKKKSYLGYCAFQFCTLLVNMNLLPHEADKELKQRIKKMDFVLKHGMCREVHIIRFVYTFFRFNATSKLLAWHFKRTK